MKDGEFWSFLILSTVWLKMYQMKHLKFGKMFYIYCHHNGIDHCCVHIQFFFCYLFCLPSLVFTDKNKTLN